MKRILFILLLLLPFLSFAQPKKLHVYVMIAEECPICNNMGPAMARIAKTYGAQVDLAAVFPLKTSTLKSANNFKKIHGLQAYATVLDKQQMLSKKLNATITPQVIITNDQEQIIYRGRINDMYNAPGEKNNQASSNDMAMAIDKALLGETIAQPWPKAIGCAITFNKR